MNDLKINLFKHQDELRELESKMIEVRQKETEIKKQIADNPGMPMTVSDHALIQFMRRALKVELQQHITNILNMCDNAEQTSDRVGVGGEQEFTYKVDGPNDTHLTFIVKNNNIVTCYVNERE